jgi:predicted Zn-dependent peptidase
VVLFRLLLICWLAFPLAAQEILDTPAGPLARKVMASGSVVLTQHAPFPVVAVTLAHGWGRAHDPANARGTVELLNKVLARNPALLLRLEEIGGTLSYSTGELWSTYTLVVPRAHAQWALQEQLQRLAGPTLKGSDWQGLGASAGMDAVALETFAAANWRPSDTVLCVVGGFEQASLSKSLEAYPAATLSAAPPQPTTAVARPGRLGWKLPSPTSARSRAASLIWQTALLQQDTGVVLDVDPADGGTWLSARCASASDCDRARSLLRQTLADLVTFAPDRLTIQAATLRHLRLWDDLPARSRWLAVEQGRHQLETALGLHAALVAYDVLGWPRDLAFATPSQVTEAAYQEEVTPGVAPAFAARPRPKAPSALGSLTPPSSPPPFVRLEFTPHRGAVVQPVAPLPLVSIRALIPGGAGRDDAAQAGRAEWLGAYWQEALSSASPTQVETGPQHWQVSCELSAADVEGWIGRFLRLLHEGQLQSEPLTRAQLKLARRQTSALQQAYHAWLRQLYPDAHPLGRQGQLPGQLARLTPARVQELANEVRAEGHWNLFVSGLVSAQQVERAVTQAGLPASTREWSPGPLPVQPEGTTNAAAFEAPVTSSTLLLGGHGPSRRDADYYAFVVLLQVLAGDPVRSRLQTELRHKLALAERIDCAFNSTSDGGPWLIRVDCEPSKLDAVHTAVQKQLEQLATVEISAEELQRAVGRLEGMQQVASQNGAGRVEQLRNLELFRLADSYNHGFAGIYRAISRKDVRLAAKTRFARRLATVLVTPARSSQTRSSPEPAPGSDNGGSSPNTLAR